MPKYPLDTYIMCIKDGPHNFIQTQNIVKESPIKYLETKNITPLS